MERKGYVLKETYKTASGEYTFQEQERTEEQKLNDIIDNYREKGEKRLLAVWGLPGCGKSHLMKRIVGNSARNTEGNEIFAAYVDISDCADESEVYYRIAIQLSDYYDIHKYNKHSEFVKKAERLIRLYEWVRGIQREKLSIHGPTVDIISEIADFISVKVTKYLELPEVSVGEMDDIVCDVLIGLSEKISFVKNIKWIVDTALNIKDLGDKYNFKKIILEKMDILDNKVMRQNFFLTELMSAMSGVKRRMIVLDNFQMDPNNELGREHTWLTTSGKILVQIDALWVIVSRMPTGELFTPLLGAACEEMELTGFIRDMAERYLFENCFICETEADYVQARENEENEKLIHKMLEVCDFNEEGVEENRKTYLPYLLRLVVLYYWNLRDDRTITISPELFAKLNEQNDFVGFYFYKDLSDLMVNAFQILSCLSAWDTVWIQKVREKFDNHLLNARNLLEHKAPIEKLGRDSFKLHEALKDGLYRNRQNYIKKDVLKHLFDSFVSIYGDKKLSSEERSIWYEQKRIETFIEVVFEYINLWDERENRKENLERIQSAMENIYDANSKRGTVTEAFIRTYCRYIDKLGEVTGISFVKTYDNKFAEEEILFDGEAGIPDVEQQRQIIYYMDRCFKLADLYTNISWNGIAWKLENLCVSFWKLQMKKVETEVQNYQNQAWYYRCWQQKVKALNSTAYDYSAEHQYKDAYEFGGEGLKSANELGTKLLDHIEMDAEERDTLSAMLNPDEQMDFSVGVAYTEIPCGLFEKMKRAYKRLLDMCKEKETPDDSFEQILYDLMVTDQQKLRGNYPWYCLHNSNLKEGDEIAEKERKKKVCQFGVRTYWMRRALAEIIKDTTSIKNMITSYHNICVYLSKCGKYEEACFLEKDVLDETLQKIKPSELNQNSLEFIKKISEYAETDLQKILWISEKLDDSKGEKFFSQSDSAIEQMQYLGDYYLNLGYYSLSQKWLAKVTLIRSVTLGAMDGKTMDTVTRFYVVLYANQERENGLLESLRKYVEEKIFRSDEYMIECQSEKIALGLLDKVTILREVIAIGDEGIEKNSQQEALANMILKINSKEKD